DSRKKISRCDILKANDICASTGTFILKSESIIAMPKSQSKTTVSLTDYRALSEFRYELMRYLALSDDAARSAGLHPGQYRLLLMAKGLPDGVEPTIGNLAERLGLRHHSTVELVDRLEQGGLIYRERSDRHRSFVFVRLTPKGETVLRKLVASRKRELQKAGPILVKALNTLTKKTRK